MKVHEVHLPISKTPYILWIATDRKISIPKDSEVVTIHEIDVTDADAGIDMIIK